MPAVLDVWAHVAPQFGGIGPSAAALAKAVARPAKWRSDLLAICDSSESERHIDIPETVRMLTNQGPRPGADVRLTGLLANSMASADVCHVHGIWEPHSLAVTRVAGRLRKPVVSSVHGMLEGWELANKRIKKQVYSKLFERPSLRRSSCLRALSQCEAEDYRRYGLKNPIAVVANGVTPLGRVDTGDFLMRFPELAEKRIVLFMARVHHKKGILNLLRAWPAVVKRHSDAHLVIAGSNYENTEQAARLIVSETDIADSVSFCGTLNGNAKLGAFSAATLFCLPSYSEGLSMSVLEALSIGLPVVITAACNVDGVAESGAGFVTSNEPGELARALTDGLSLTQAQWRTISDAARLLALSRYDWERVGASMRAVYEWLLGGARPDCVLS